MADRTNDPSERSQAMPMEIAEYDTHGFVQDLKSFHASLPAEKQEQLETLLLLAEQGAAGDLASAMPSTPPYAPDEAWEKVETLLEEVGDTTGFYRT